MPDFDLIIRGGTVVDGSGHGRYRADVGVRDGRIVKIGRITASAEDEIDAEGHFVTPGFIDGHTHLDAQVIWDGLSTGPSWHGVTTVIMGNCGFSLAPCRESEQDMVFASLERAEDIPRETLQSGLDWKWETYADYLENLRNLPKGIDYAGYVGHNALRPYVMGERAFTEPATEDDINAMRREVRSAVQAGAMGLSTSRFEHHFTSGGVPVPSRSATWEELDALLGELDDLGQGVLQIIGTPFDPDLLEGYHDRLHELALANARPIMVPTSDTASLNAFERTASAGGNLLANCGVRTFESVIGFRAHLQFDSLPTWSDVRARPLEEQRVALLDPAVREKLVDEAMNMKSGATSGPEHRPPVYDQLCVVDSGLGPYRTVSEIASERGVSPVDVIIDLSLESNFDQLFSQPLGRVVPDDQRVAVMSHRRSVVAISDAGAHMASSLHYNVPTYMLGYWVREREAFTWEQGVRLLTFVPATAWGFWDRGLVREGYAADLTIFDPETIGPDVPYAENDLPGGAKRLKQKAHGIRATVVNGVTLYRDGEHQGAYPGQVVTGRR